MKRTAVFALLGISVVFGVASPAPCTAQEGKAVDEVPQASKDLVEKARKVLKHWYGLRRKALRDQHKFDAKEAWDAAAKEGGYENQADFDKAVTNQKKIDPKHFPKLYSAMREEVMKVHLEEVKKDEDDKE